jgi:hypothetical protein
MSSMKPLWQIPLILILTALLQPQETKHAPTVEQCRADGKLWLSQFESSEDESRIDVPTLSSRLKVMIDCKSVDPEKKTLYRDVGSLILSAQAVRMQAFLFRHGL